MDRWNWSVLRAYAPALMALVVAYSATALLARWQADPALAGLAARLAWVPYLALGLSALSGAWVSARLWRTERRAGLLCDCGGLLGGDRRDRQGRLRRTCRQCGRHWRH